MSDQVFWLGSNNARHRATIAGTYDFPFGKGRKFGSSMHPILNAAYRRLADQRHLHLPLRRVSAHAGSG